VQRFGSAVNLNLHYHTLVLDGVYVERNGAASFWPLPPPTQRDVERLCAAIARRVGRLLVRGGIESEAPDPLAEDEPLLASISAASIQSLIATGDRAGASVARDGDQVDVDETPPRRGPLCAEVRGFSLQGAVAVPANDRSRLERQVRYVARPPIAAERLSQLSDGRLAYELKKKWSDGTTHVVFRPEELIEKLVALIPAPRRNLIRYHGVLAAHARLRQRVVAQAKRPSEPEPPDSAAGSPPPGPTAAPRPGRYLSWAELLRRVFEIDVLECPACGGRMRILATLTEETSIASFLRGIGVSSEVPRFAPARSPPPELSFDFA